HLPAQVVAVGSLVQPQVPQLISALQLSRAMIPHRPMQVVETGLLTQSQTLARMAPHVAGATQPPQSTLAPQASVSCPHLPMQVVALSAVQPSRGVEGPPATAPSASVPPPLLPPSLVEPPPRPPAPLGPDWPASTPRIPSCGSSIPRIELQPSAPSK